MILCIWWTLYYRMKPRDLMAETRRNWCWQVTWQWQHGECSLSIFILNITYSFCCREVYLFKKWPAQQRVCDFGRSQTVSLFSDSLCKSLLYHFMSESFNHSVRSKQRFSQEETFGEALLCFVTIFVGGTKWTNTIRGVRCKLTYSSST